MFAKIFIAIVVMVIVGAALLSFRTSKHRAMHQMSQVHVQMVDAQKQMWNLQTNIAQQSDPSSLKNKLIKAGIKDE